MHNFKEKLEQLEIARTQLKAEFFGIDETIDQLIEFTTPWFCLEDYQKRPRIVPLFGMTGVGKSSLLERFMELMEHDKKYFHFDMKDLDGGWELNQRLGEIHREYSNKAFVLCLDEFQFAGRVSKSPFSEGKEEFKNIWKLLDDGKVTLRDHYHMTEHETLLNFINDLRHLIRGGLKAENGMVSQHTHAFIQIMKKREVGQPFEERTLYDNEVGQPKLVPSRIRSIVFDQVKSRFKDHFELSDHFDSMDEVESLEYLKSIYLESLQPKVLDGSKALIFVIANLDDAYHMHGNLDPDINADTFYKASLEVDILDIKRSLREKFRDEQIARLGNSMVVYPALSSDAYYSIINRELERIQIYWAEFSEKALRFDDTFLELLFEQGVYPSQGARPLLSTIEQIAWNFITKLIVEVEGNAGAVPIRILHENEQVVAHWDEGEAIVILTQEYQDRNHTMKKRLGTEAQALIAAHEAGHAVVHITYNKEFPERIMSMSGSHERLGGVFFPWTDEIKLDSYKKVMHKMAVDLGGFAGEKLLFGKENASMGSYGDLSEATTRAQALIRDHGFGQHRALFFEGNPDETFKLKSSDDNEQEILALIKKAEEMAEKAIQLNYPLFIALSQELSENRVMEQEDIKALAQKVGYTDLSEDFSYRKKVRESKVPNQLGEHRINILKGNTTDQTTKEPAAYIVFGDYKADE